MQGILLAIAIVLIVIGAVILTLYSPWWFTPKASNWGEIDSTLMLTIVVTGVAFIAVNLFIAYLVVRYRQRNGSKAAFIPEHPRLEWGLIGLTTLGVIALLAPGLFVYSSFITAPEEAMLVEVMGEQWRWSFRFPGADGKLGHADPKRIDFENPFGIDPTDPAAQDDILVRVSELHLPVGVPVKLQLRSKDVLHSFYVPHFRVKMDLVPGMVTHLWLKPTRKGRFEIACAEFCGIGHHAMRGIVVVEGMEAFQRWLASQPTFAEIRGRSSEED